MNRILSIFTIKVYAVDKDGAERAYEADKIYYALGVRANTEELHELMTVCPRTNIVGDCKRPARILQAMRDGMFVAMDII